MGNCCASNIPIKQHTLKSNELFTPLQQIVKQYRKQYETQQLVVCRTLKNGVFYKGGFKDQKREGYGEMIHPNFAYYGIFQEGLPHGEGLMVHNSHHYYIGQFKKGLKDGKGKEIAGQVSMTGQFCSGQFHQGTYTDKSIVYTGSLRGGVFEGQGLLEFQKEKVTMSGLFRAHSLVKGKIIYSCPEIEEVYEGDLKGMLYQGRGRYTWSKLNSQQNCKSKAKNHQETNKKQSIVVAEYSGSYLKGQRIGETKVNMINNSKQLDK